MTWREVSNEHQPSFEAKAAGFPEWFREVYEDLNGSYASNVIINVHGDNSKVLTKKIRRGAGHFSIHSVSLDLNPEEAAVELKEISRRIADGLEIVADAPLLEPIFDEDDANKAAEKARMQINRIQEAPYKRPVGIFLDNVDKADAGIWEYVRDEIIIPSFRYKSEDAHRPRTLVVLSTDTPVRFDQTDDNYKPYLESLDKYFIFEQSGVNTNLYSVKA